jgi:peptidylprolyl isomerase
MRKLAVAALPSVPPRPGHGLEIDVEGDAQGTIVIDLLEEVAPQHVERITTLAAAGAYDDVVFHRVIDGFMAQTGDVEYGVMGMDMRYAGRGGSEFAGPAGGVLRHPLRARHRRHGARAKPQQRQFAVLHHVRARPAARRAIHRRRRVVDGMEIVDAIKRGTGRNGAVVGQPDRMVALRVLEEDPVPPEEEAADTDG